MITREDFIDSADEGFAVGEYVIAHCKLPLAAALAGAALLRAYIKNEDPSSKQFFLELVASPEADVESVVHRHVGSRGAG